MKRTGPLPIYKRLVFVAGCALASLLSQRVAAQVVIIANPGMKVAEISKAELRDVFTGVASGVKGGGHLVPVLLREGPVNDEFLNLYIGRSDAAFRTGWRSVLFSGQGVMPKTFDSEASVVEYVAHTAGAIGYVGKAAVHESVKIVTVK